MNGSQWGTMQIVTPAIVGGALILIFVAYIIWKRRPGRERSRAYDYRPVHSGWATKMFFPRPRRNRVHPSSMPTTLDNSMRLSSHSGLMPDFGRTRLPRSGSTDSQVPLTSSYALDYTPFKSHPDSPPPFSKRRGFRWWWIFGSRPRQVKSAEPSVRWLVDGPEGASSQGHVDTQPLEALEAAREDQDEEDSVIQIGENLPSIASTPMTQHFPEQARAIRGMSPVPEHSGSAGARTPLSAAGVSRNNTGTPVSLFMNTCMSECNVYQAGIAEAAQFTTKLRHLT